MDLESLRAICLSFPDVTEETPFGPDTLVFKKRGKMIALTSLSDFRSVNLKCEPQRAIEYREQFQAVEPGYHMNKKHWNTVQVNLDVDDGTLKSWIKDSYDLIKA